MSEAQDCFFGCTAADCEYAGGECDQNASATVVSADGFVVYPSEPEFISSTIEQAVKSLKSNASDLVVNTWRSMHISGQIIFCEICKSLRASRAAIADVTTLNFNVLFEIGYALGLGLTVMPVRDTTVVRDTKDFDELGILDVLGYIDFQNSVDLAAALPEALRRARPVSTHVSVNFEQPLFFVKSHIHSEGVVKLLSALKKSGIKFRTFDPRETSRLSLHDALKQVNSSLGVVAHLVSQDRRGASAHNGRSALLCGLAMAAGKRVLMLQEGEFRQPIDYRDIIASYSDPAKVPSLVVPFIKRLVDALQPSRFVPTVLPLTPLEMIDLGDLAAENEISALRSYFVATAQYNEARRGHGRLVVGRKGAGKTAIFYSVRNAFWNSRSHLVLDLKPEGHQFTKLREAVLTPLSRGMQEHVLTAFWSYLLLMEIALKIVREEKQHASRNPERAALYEAVQKAAGIDLDFEQGDFSERLLTLVDSIVARRGCMEDILRTENVTELIYASDVRLLQETVAAFLQSKEGVWLLIDNLDKGWPVGGAQPEDILLLRCLLEATRKLQRQLERRDVEFRCIVFIRNDVFDHLLSGTPDKGKDTAILLQWTDAEAFKEVLRRRIVASTGHDDIFERLWATYFDTHVRGEDSFTYMLSRTLLRPRDLLRFVRQCVNVAVNRGHPKVTEDDILTAEKAYSDDQLQEVSFELQDISPSYGDVLYAFIGVQPVLSSSDVQTRLRAAGTKDEDLNRVVELLLWFGFLGVLNRSEEEDERYSSHYQHRVERMLMGLPSPPTYVVHPAFRTALGAVEI